MVLPCGMGLQDWTETRVYWVCVVGYVGPSTGKSCCGRRLFLSKWDKKIMILSAFGMARPPRPEANALFCFPSCVK